MNPSYDAEASLLGHFLRFWAPILLIVALVSFMLHSEFGYSIQLAPPHGATLRLISPTQWLIDTGTSALNGALAPIAGLFS